METIVDKSKLYYNSALKYINEGQISKASKELRKAIGLFYRDVETLNLSGLTYYLLCDFNMAKYYWTISSSLNSEDNRAVYYLETLESDEFKEMLEKYNAAIKLAEGSNYEEAINKLKSLIDSNEELIEPFAIVGLCYVALGEFDKASSYIEKAIEKDKDNAKYLKYLAEINKHRNHESKPARLTKYHKILIAALTSFFTVFLILYLKEQIKYNQVFMEYTDVQQEYNNMNLVLIAKDNEINMLKDNLTAISSKGENKEREDDFKNINENDKYLSEDEKVLFKKAYDDLLNDKYEEAIEQFEFIAIKGVEKNLAQESMYFLAVSYERNKDYSNAAKYYEKYISKYTQENYYDDSLYDYGILLYKQGNAKDSKVILNKLKSEVPNSIFNNSKVEFILNN